MASGNFIKNLTGFASSVNLTGEKRSNNQAISIGTPWDQKKPAFEGSFFRPIEIQGQRWDKIYPYRILVVKKNSSGDNYTVVSRGGSGVEAITDTVNKFKIVFKPLGDIWEYQLPITPQQLSIVNPFAVNISATQRGIVEENSGTRFKIINCSGTFGVWPERSNINGSNRTPPTPSVVQSLFAGTLRAFEGVTNQFNRLSNILQGSNHPANKPKSVDAANSFYGYEGTGYVQALLLDQFLEQYHELKRLPENSDLRLAFDIPKQNQTYLVSASQFTYNQAADSPNEYKFNLQLKAYKRIKITRGEALNSISIPRFETNTLQKVLTAVTEARRTLAASYNLVRAVRSDFNNVFNALRETSLFVKELSGLVASVVDLPTNIISDSRLAIADAFANLDQAQQQVRATQAKLAGDLEKMKNLKKEREGQPLPTLSDLDPSLIPGSLSLKTTSVNNLFEVPEQNFDLFNSLTIQDVVFSKTAQDAIDNEIARVSLTTADDLQKNKAILQDLAFQISNAFGTGNTLFSKIYEKPAPKQRLQEITIDEYDVLKKIYDVIQYLGVLILNDDVNQNQNAAYEFVKAEANNSGIIFEDSKTKIRVPVPFGLTIEQIAARYLNNQERWLEIVTINALKSPYIDEDGFTRPFLSNGDGRQFNIQSNIDMFVGQKVFLFSNTQPRQRRTITDIEKIGENNFLITVDGLDNLDIFTIADNATMLAYLPGTVNSQDQIFVPSTLPQTDDIITRPLPATQDDVLTGLSRIDLLLTPDSDIALNSFGDFRLAFGLTNLFQALKLKFITEPGQLIRHPDFGSGLRPGASNADITSAGIYNTVAALIAQDPRFSGIERMEVKLDGPFADVNLSVFINNGLGVFPISFRLSL